MKKTVYILSGISGSGKSTWVRKSKLESVSTDELVEEYGQEHGYDYTQAFNEIQKLKLFGTLNSIFYDNIVDKLNTGKNFAIDRTSLNSRTRKELIEFIRTNNGDINVVVVYFDIDKDTIIKRLKSREEETGKGIPDFVIDKQFENQEKPDDEEGYDAVIIVQ